MQVLYAFLFMFFFVGLGFTPPIATTKTPRLRQILFASSLVLVNGDALIALGLGYLVTRLEGSRPPSFSDYLAPLWLPLVLILIIDGVTIFINERRRTIQ